MKLVTAAAFALALNAIPVSAQQLWTPQESGDWDSIEWSNGSQYGTPGDEDEIRINYYSVTNGSATHTGDIGIFYGGKLSLTSYAGQLQTGKVEVNGTGSEWVTSGLQKFNRVEGKIQNLTVSNGGKMQTWSTQIGITTQQNTQATVKNLGSQLIQLERLTVGYTGNGSLSVSDKASVTANNSIIADAVGSIGEVTVAGDQTTFDSGARLTVGKQGTGNLEISKGGVATAKIVTIGGQADNGIGVKGNGTVKVTGGAGGGLTPYSVLSATEGGIEIGKGGKGTLTVEDGGEINSASPILLGSNDGWGTLRILNGSLVKQAVVNADEIRGDGGKADILFLGFGNVELDSNITGNAAVTILGSFVTLTGNNTYTGGTSIVGADSALSVENANQVGTGKIFVNGGTLYSSVSLDNQIELVNGNYIRQVEEGADLEVNLQSGDEGVANTTAGILAGTQSTASAVTTSFGLASDAGNDDLRISDVFSISGTGDSVFVLELAVDDLQPGAFLSWLDTDSGLWVNAIDGNIGNTDYSLEQFLGTYEEFSLLNGGGLADHLGAWGIYDSGAWAVINHNSDFSIVAPIPEPSTYALILGGAVALHFIRRKRK